MFIGFSLVLFCFVCHLCCFSFLLEQLDQGLHCLSLKSKNCSIFRTVTVVIFGCPNSYNSYCTHKISFFVIFFPFCIISAACDTMGSKFKLATATTSSPLKCTVSCNTELLKRPYLRHPCFSIIFNKNSTECGVQPA